MTAVAAFFFYLFIPVIGAFIVKKQWKSFRLSVYKTEKLPELEEVIAQHRTVSLCLAKGEINAIEGENELWVKGSKFFFIIDLKDSIVFILSTNKGQEDIIERQNWKDLKTISPGSRVFCSGIAEMKNGRLILDKPDFVIIHDGDDNSVVRRAIWSGRHLNEYWNQLTQISIIIGVAATSTITMLSLGPWTPALLLSLMLAIILSPILPLLPPGVLGFFLYRRYWRKARYLRARRDSARLNKENNAIIKNWKKKALLTVALSVFVIILSIVSNGFILVYALRQFL